MKLSTFATGAAFALSTVAFSGAANALVMDYSGSDVNMGTTQIGQSGTISNNYASSFSLPPNTVGSGEVYGFLPSLSKITFSYTFTGASQAELQGYGTYNYTGTGFYGVGQYDGSSKQDTNVAGTTDVGHFNGAPALPLVWSTANLNGVSTGTTTIQNNSQNGTFAQFQSLFFGVLNARPAGTVTIHYAVSAIPLPAALPLFAALIAGMFGFARFGKRKHAALAA